MLDLDSIQQEKFKAIKLEHEAKMDDLKEKEHLAKKAFFDLLKSDTANSATINTFARKAADVSFEIDTTTYFYFKKLKSICTPKQAEILADIFDRAPMQHQPFQNNPNRPKEGKDTGNNQSVNSVSDKKQNRGDNFNRDDRPPPPPRFEEDGNQMDPGFDPPPPPRDGKRPPGPPHPRGDRRRPPPPHERPIDEP
jgi:hypothetical protein